jgi:DNA-binding Lrp family transcriptional regulator
MTNNKTSTTNNKSNSDILHQSPEHRLAIDELDQRLLELLLRGYKHKKIALEANAPLSTIQRRIRKIFDNQYIYQKNELNYRKLGLRKSFLQITLKGNYSNVVAQKISRMAGITSVSQVTGAFDILCVCLFRDVNDLFKIIENIKTIERVDSLSWSEEVRGIPMEGATRLEAEVSIERNSTLF